MFKVSQSLLIFKRAGHKLLKANSLRWTPWGPCVLISGKFFQHRVLSSHHVWWHISSNTWTMSKTKNKRSYNRNGLIWKKKRKKKKKKPWQRFLVCFFCFKLVSFNCHNLKQLLNNYYATVTSKLILLKILPIRDSAVPPGHPTVDRAGPLLPALDTNITLCLSTSSFMSSIIRLQHNKEQKLNKHNLHILKWICYDIYNTAWLYCSSSHVRVVNANYMHYRARGDAWATIFPTWPL